MIAVDTNILVYAHRGESPFHEAAVREVERLRSGQAVWAVPWPCVHEFISVVTHPKIYSPASPLRLALDAVERWNSGGNLQLLAESNGYWETLAELAEKGRVQGPKIHDARIAAICLRHGVRELWTADRDFSAFPRLTTRNPLV